ncbi:hypothetical protein V8E53_006856, partial [Lactarius tabidus]
MSSSTSIPEEAYEEPSEGPLEGWGQAEREEHTYNNEDDDEDEDNDYNYSLPSPAPHPPSVITSASSQTLAVPSVTISQPSGLPISTITSLTHDELRHNPEFMKHVNLVSLLQELLNLRKTAPSNFCSKPLSTSSSLAPIQSASQVSPSLVHSNTFMSFPCKAKCPNKFLPSILWTWEDCKTDPSVGMSSSNMSRPPIEAEWKAICQSVMVIICSNLDPLTPAAQARAHQSRKKMYFKHYFPIEWSLALCELESLAHLLSLCAREYKADMTLGSVLQDEVTCKQHDAAATHVDSHTSSPSNLGTPSRGAPSSCSVPSSCSASSHIGPPRGTISHIGPPCGSSRGAPPSRSHPASSPIVPPPSSTSPSSSTHHSRLPLPHCIALNSSQKGSKPPPTATSKASPIQAEKWAKSTEAADTVQCRSPPPPPSLPWSTLPSPPNALSTETAPHKP